MLALGAVPRASWMQKTGPRVAERALGLSFPTSLGHLSSLGAKTDRQRPPVVGILLFGQELGLFPCFLPPQGPLMVPPPTTATPRDSSWPRGETGA